MLDSILHIWERRAVPSIFLCDGRNSVAMIEAYGTGEERVR